MLPTEQGSCAYSFVQGQYSAGTFDVGLAADFDFAITGIDFSVAAAVATAAVYIAKEGGTPFLYVQADDTTASGLYIGQWRGFAVVEAGNNLAVTVGDNGTNLNISGFVLTPSRVALFG